MFWPWFASKPPTDGENYLRAASKILHRKNTLGFVFLQVAGGAGPNERRCIVRESLDYYRALLVGGVYEFSLPVDTSSVSTYIHAVRQCVDCHPHLSIIIADAETESPYYEFSPRLDLSQHIQIINLDYASDNTESQEQAIERTLPHILDAQWPAGLPPWKLVVIPFSQTRCFISFSYSHSLADGTSGLAFHRSFLNALRQQTCNGEEKAENNLIYAPKRQPFSPPFDTAENLPISWSYLLTPLLATYLPSGLRPHSHIDPITPKTWTGSSMFHYPETFKTGVRTLSVDSTTVDKALKACRANGAKLTGLIHQFIVSALSECLPNSDNFDSFAGNTAIDMRQLVNVSKHEMGLYISGEKQVLEAPKRGTKGTDLWWESSRLISQNLAATANKRHDQAIGLLRYLSNMRAWMQNKIGERRDCSYEVSNLLSFQSQSASDPAPKEQRCSVVEMVFAQPADVTGAPLAFNIVSVANGPLTIAVSWQLGALDVEPKISETEFVRNVCESIKHSFDDLI